MFNAHAKYWPAGCFRLWMPLDHEPDNSILSTTLKPLSKSNNAPLSTLANSEGEEGFQSGSSVITFGYFNIHIDWTRSLRVTELSGALLRTPYVATHTQTPDSSKSQAMGSALCGAEIPGAPASGRLGQEVILASANKASP